MHNRLQVRLADFKHAARVFKPARRKLGSVLLCFEGGFLSIESGGAAAVMRADGEWHGRAAFSPQVLRALTIAPP